MPSQEDRVIARMKIITAYITDFQPVKIEMLYAWAHVTLGIRERTAAGYLKSLAELGCVKFHHDEIGNQLISATTAGEHVGL